MLKIITFLMILCACVKSNDFDGANSFFYTPIKNDPLLKSKDIDKNLKSLKKSKATEIFIQFSAIENYDFLADKEFNKLEALLFKNQIRVVYGLYNDEKYDRNIKKENIKSYFKILREQHFLQYEKIIKRQDRTQLGFFVNETVDDVNFNSAQNRKALIEHFKLIKANLPENRVYFASKFYGNLPPKDYTLFIKQIADSTGLIPIIFDGNSSKNLNDFEINIYLNEFIENFETLPIIAVEIKKSDDIESRIENLMDNEFENISIFSLNEIEFK